MIVRQIDSGINSADTPHASVAAVAGLHRSAGTDPKIEVKMRAGRKTAIANIANSLPFCNRSSLRNDNRTHMHIYGLHIRTGCKAGVRVVVVDAEQIPH